MAVSLEMVSSIKTLLGGGRIFLSPGLSNSYSNAGPLLVSLLHFVCDDCNSFMIWMIALAAEGAGWTWGFSLLAPGLYSNRAQYLGSSRWRLHGHASKNADEVVMPCCEWR